MAQGVWGMEISLQGPGAESRWWFGAEPPEARYAYTICSGQTYFRDVFIENIQGGPAKVREANLHFC